MSDTNETVLGVDKIAKYRWQPLDELGEFKLIHKASLAVDKSYQRRQHHEDSEHRERVQLEAVRRPVREP